jgi:hypothetical protein
MTKSPKYTLIIILTLVVGLGLGSGITYLVQKQNNNNTSSSTSSSSNNNTSSTTSTSTPATTVVDSSGNNSTGTQTNTNTSNTLTYTDPIFPNFKLVYDKSWSLVAKDLPNRDSSVYGDLVGKNISLTKNTSSINFAMEIGHAGDCGLGVNQPTIVLDKSFSNGIDKWILNGGDDKEVNDVVYTKNNSNVRSDDPTHSFEAVCMENNELTSNILISSVKGDYSNTADYTSNGLLPTDKYVPYSFVISSTELPDSTQYVPNNYNKTTDPLISEIDKIISDSSFN